MSISTSDSETSRPFKRSRMDDEAFQSSSARDVSLSSNICFKSYLNFQYHLSDLMHVLFVVVVVVLNCHPAI